MGLLFSYSFGVLKQIVGSWQLFAPVLLAAATVHAHELATQVVYFQGPQKDISISILWGYPCLIGLHYNGLLSGMSLS